MPNQLRVTLVQAHLAWENISQNLAHFTRLLAPLSGQTDLVLLPEMFTTGFSMQAAALAEEIPGTTFSWMLNQAQKLDAAVVGSLIVKEADQYYNRLLFVRPDGTFEQYDKRHLFTLAGEHEAYIAGQQNISIEWKGWKLRPQICYDLRFPVWSRNTDDYDLIFYLANWPNKRRNAWMNLLAARAIENQAYCIGVNRVGVDEKGHQYTGDSSVYDYSGELLSQITNQEACVTVQLELQTQVDFRSKLNFLADRDDFRVV
ncbi:MAG: nitrilase family protein [Saprospiraceae bacterium]